MGFEISHNLIVLRRLSIDFRFPGLLVCNDFVTRLECGVSVDSISIVTEVFFSLLFHTHIIIIINLQYNGKWNVLAHAHTSHIHWMK